MAKRRKRKSKRKNIIAIIITILVLIYNFYYQEINNLVLSYAYKINSYSIDEIPKYNGKSYVYINNNEPNFDESDFTTISFEQYSNQDYLRRSRVAFANVGYDLMPNSERESIGMVKPTGWHTVKYDIVDGKYLYNRCHLIGFQLTGENANEKNLITCTRQMNTLGMLEWENKVTSYIKNTKNHVLYRVTPIYDGLDLLAKGVQMEAISVEDRGKGIKFNIFVYNVQDGIEIDYSNGDSKLKNVDN